MAILRSGGNPQEASIQILTMNGISTTNVIALTDDSTAIMVPPSSQIPDTIGYVATTLGVKSTCTSVTAQCIDMGNLGPDAGLETNCSSAVNFNTTSLGCNTFGAERGNGGPLGADGEPLPCGQTTNST